MHWPDEPFSSALFFIDVLRLCFLFLFLIFCFAFVSTLKQISQMATALFDNFFHLFPKILDLWFSGLWFVDSVYTLATWILRIFNQIFYIHIYYYFLS